MAKLFLSRRNLQTLLNKLDRVKTGDSSGCTLIKSDPENKLYKQSPPKITVTAVEDADYYHDRLPGEVHPADDPSNEILDEKKIMSLLRSGLSPNFRSLGGILNDAAQAGARAFYLRKKSGMTLADDNDLHAKIKLVRLSDSQIEQIIQDNSIGMVKAAAKVGFNAISKNCVAL